MRFNSCKNQLVSWSDDIDDIKILLGADAISWNSKKKVFKFPFLFYFDSYIYIYIYVYIGKTMPKYSLTLKQNQIDLWFF